MISLSGKARDDDVRADVGKLDGAMIDPVRQFRALEFVPLLGLEPAPERPQLAAAHHSENTYDFLGRQDGPIKGMGF